MTLPASPPAAAPPAAVRPVTAKRSDVEDLHFRLDELTREMEVLKKKSTITQQQIGIMVHQALSSLIANNEIPPNSSVELAIRELVETLKKPTTRTAVMNLPSGGAAQMTVTERRS